MKNLLKSAGLLLALTIVLGTGPMTAPALAGPDLEPYQRTGWDAPVIASANADQSGAHGPLPAQLFGSVPSFFGMSMFNSGDAPGNINVPFYIRLDDLSLWGLLGGTGQGENSYGFNQEATITGGRHTVWMDIDPENVLAEDDETNNQTARQFVWTPVVQPHNTVMQYVSPPDPWIGQEFLPGGTQWKANVDAVTLQSGGEFGFIVAVAGALEEGNDYDVYLHPRPTNAVDGLDTTDPLAVSQVGGTFVDGVALNDNHLSISERFSVSVMNYGATDSPYLLDIGRSLVPRSTGYVLDGTFASNQLVHVEEWSLVSDTEPRTALLDVPGAGQEFTLAVYDPQTGMTSLRDNLGMATTDENGRATVTFTPDQGGFYGVAVFRNAFEGTAAEDFTLRLIDAPADLALAVLPGSHAPATPYLDPLPVPFGDPLPAPTTLVGDSFVTGVYMHYSNLGPGSIGIASLGIRRNGQPIAFTSTPALEPDPNLIGTYDFDTISFPGGRNTLSMHLDSSDQHFELDESNNDFAEQWIWQPAQLSVAGSRERGSPPLREGGHEFIPEGVVRQDNIHGVRSPAFQDDGDDGFWAGVSILAAEDVDFDLRLFDPSTGATDGFVDPLKTSDLGSSQVDFILMNFNQTSLGQFWDIGVERYLGEAYYSVQVSHTRWMGEIDQASDILEESGSLAGIGATAGRESMALFEFKLEDELANQPMSITLENISGGANLNLRVFQDQDGAAFLNYLDDGEFAHSGDSGENETLTITPDEGGYFAVAVLKEDHEDYFIDAEFRLVVALDSLSPVPDSSVPTFTGLESVYPNPFNPRTTVKLAMQQPGEAQVRVYDVSGRLVRTLHQGHLEAGSHDLDWSGQDDAGRSVPSGLYFVRAVHPGGSSSMRMSLVK